MIFLQDHQAFPPVDQANKEGILAVSMNLSIVRLLEAYHKGIFHGITQTSLFYGGHPTQEWFCFRRS